MSKDLTEITDDELVSHAAGGD
jgi:RNA polymerase sigma-70 factor (ECF subfamily)